MQHLKDQVKEQDQVDGKMAEVRAAKKSGWLQALAKEKEERE